MEIILNRLTPSEFFENGGVIEKNDGTEQIQDRSDFDNIPNEKMKEYTCRIGSKYYEYSPLEASFYYRDISNYLPEKDPYGIKNVNFTLIDNTDDRWEEYRKQRLERGFDDSELWSLDSTIAEFVYPRLKAFYNEGDMLGYPARLTKNKWHDILKSMIKAFDIIVNKNIIDYTKEERKQVDNGLRLFAEYFSDLWY